MNLLFPSLFVKVQLSTMTFVFEPYKDISSKKNESALIPKLLSNLQFAIVTLYELSL